MIAPSGSTYGSLTTPDPIELHRLVDRLAGDGVTHLAVEASSHGLDQHRLDGLSISAAAFTNLGRDHLDYHPTMEAYLAAKLRLFAELLPPDGTAVVPISAAVQAGIAEVLDAARRRGLKIVTTAAVEGAAPAARDLRARVTMASGRRRAGRAAADIRAAGRRPHERPAAACRIVPGLERAGGCRARHRDRRGSRRGHRCAGAPQGVPGRLDLAGRKDGAGIFVDYAHKPEALGEALAALRPFVGKGGRLIVVFGAGGDRDPGKRPLMGAIAAERADVAVVTDDNPRSEDPATIRRAILAAAPKAVEIGDRAQAIRWAVGELKSGDILLIAGKGHETGQIVGDRVLPFTDHGAVRAALGEGAA